MTNQDWIEMLKVFPQEEHNTLVIVLQNGAEVNVDTLFRFEPNFLVMRGRVGGNVDEGRGFFIPYNQMLYFRIERVTNIAELRDIMDGSSFRRNMPEEETFPTAEPELPVAPVPVEGPAAVTDATANRNALLARIRAARTTQLAPRRGGATQ
jgi:hypothetical protein